MENRRETGNRVCPFCKFKFTAVGAMNRHIRNIHKEPVPVPVPVQVQGDKKCHIICPLCREIQFICRTLIDLQTHFKKDHNISMEVITTNFSNIQTWEKWMDNNKIGTNYAIRRTIKKSGFLEKMLVCNRSNETGYKSNPTKRTEKARGTIKMFGCCPSRLTVKLFETGECSVTFWKTHVGHEQEIRCQHLSNNEKAMIVEKLASGVTVERIISDARNISTGSLQRINMIQRKDIAYLAKKHNITKRKHENTMIAVSLKVSEWNANGKNYCFFFKQQGENHPVLRVQDFCLGFMNENMENKLKDFSRIICMDGTHCTNQKGMDLTIVLVKDDKNMGFPVAFFLSNRLDQVVQEIFIGALQEKLGEVIQPEYFMTDDDPKYYNAWTKVMGEGAIRRLLCSWHVIKNWIIQGRAKIKNEEIKKSMKADMKKIMNETKIEKFVQLSESYFERLQNANEVDFLNYLKKYYYQSEERIAMWAHCHRVNAGVNTNMALESLNNLLKTNQLKRKTNITIDRLLDEIENLVDAKMWQRIINIERPNSDSYQDKITIRAHKEAEKMDKTTLTEIGFGSYQVKSSKSEHYYNISYNEICESECRAMYCRVCKICFHLYKCECPQYEIKTTICKHIHLVCLYEQGKRSVSILDDVNKLAQEGQSNIKSYHDEEIQKFIEQKTNQNQDESNTNEVRKVEVEAHANSLMSLDDKSYNKCMKQFGTILEKANKSTKKRKMAKQEFFSVKKNK